MTILPKTPNYKKSWIKQLDIIRTSKDHRQIFVQPKSQKDLKAVETMKPSSAFHLLMSLEQFGVFDHGLENPKPIQKKKLTHMDSIKFI